MLPPLITLIRRRADISLLASHFSSLLRRHCHACDTYSREYNIMPSLYHAAARRR